ncbi:hypothetical protein GCM10027299_45370 [Larkinella ripae]
MKFILPLLFLLFGGAVTDAQTPKLDSLDRLIAKATTDTARINRVTTKISLLSEVNIDSALSLSLRTVEKAKQIGYKSGEAMARLLAAQNYNYKGEFATAHQYLKVAESMFVALNDSSRIQKVYNTFGAMYGMQSKYDSSISYFEKSAAIAKQLNNRAVLGTIYSNLGASYQMLSNLPQALHYQQLSLTIAEAEQDRNGQAYSLVNLANTYKLLRDWKGAEQRFQRAIRLAQLEGIKNVELYAYSNLAAMYTETNTQQKAYEFALKAANLAREMGDPGIEATSLSRAATNLANLKRFGEAEKLNRQAMGIADASRQPLNIHQTYSAMGSILKMQNNCAAAIPYYEKSFEVMKEADIYDEQTGIIYRELSNCYEAVGNYRRALATYKTAAAITDSIRGKENVRKTTELTMTYEFEKKQQTARVEQQKENELARTRQRALLAGMGLMLGLAAVSFYAFRTKQKANGLLQQQKEELERTLGQLQSTQLQLIQSEKMASLGELTAGIAHEIQNPLNFVNNFSEVSTELVEELKEGPIRAVAESERGYATEILGDLTLNLQKINHHGRRADSIVKGMLEHSRTSGGEKKRTNLNALADEYLKLAYHGQRAKDKEFQVELITDFEESLKPVEVMPQELGRVLLNLFNNAFYAVREKQKTALPAYQPTVTVRTRRNRDRVEIQVTDNGIGIPDGVQQKIFQPFFTTKPTGQGTGLGLSLSYDIVTKAHQGTVEVQSKPGEGTQMLIRLPV